MPLRSRAIAQLCTLLFAGSAIGAPPVEDATPPDARAIVARAFENLYGFHSVQRVTIRSSRADGREFVRTAQVVRRGASGGLNRMLVRFLAPGDLGGIGLLLLERPDLGYDAFLYQPALERIRRVSVAQRHDRFFGTDLAFEDLEAKRATQWSAHLLREEEVGGRLARVIELSPRDVPSGYERMVFWFDDRLPIMLRAEFYRGGRLLKTLEVDAEEVIEVGGFSVPTRLTFASAGDSVTVVEISEVDLRPELSEELFTKSVLQFGDARLDARIHSPSERE